MNKVILIDDEPLARSILAEYLESFPEFEVVAECENGFEGIKAIGQFRPDLIFLDIQMPKISGFEMLELIQDCPPVIFTTAFDSFALKAFDTHAIDYLLKPFSRERLAQALDKWGQKRTESAGIQELLSQSHKQVQEGRQIVVKVGADIRILPIQDVAFLEAFDDYVKIHVCDKYFLKKKTLHYYEEVLDPNLFFRVHRSFLLNLQHLSRIEILGKNSYLVVVRNGSKIPLSRQYYGPLKDLLGL